MLDLRHPRNCDNVYWDGIFSEHTVEHLSPPQAMTCFSDCYRCLKPTKWPMGTHFSALDLDKYIKNYNGVGAVDPNFLQCAIPEEAIQSLTQGHAYQSGWAGKLLERSLREAGFCEVRTCAFRESRGLLLAKRAKVSAGNQFTSRGESRKSSTQRQIAFPLETLGQPFRKGHPMSKYTRQDRSLGASEDGWGVCFEKKHVFPSISIVVPSYNQGAFLEMTLQSITQQGYPKLELIVMDGGSSDNSRELIRKYESSITLLRVGKDKGQSDALQKGFDLATGDILAWLNSDDLYCENTLQRVGRFFSTHPRHVFCCGDVQEIDENAKRLRLLRAVKPVPFLTRHCGAHGTWQPGCFWRRETYQAVGGIDPDLFFCMDRDLFIRICSAGQSARLGGPPLACFRVHGEQKSQKNLKEFAVENALMFQRYSHPAMASYRGLLARCYGVWRRLGL
jgi:hypothetical protein